MVIIVVVVVLAVLLQDFAFILKGLTRLLNNPLLQTYLPGSCKRIQFHQELLIFFWKLCDINKVMSGGRGLCTCENDYGLWCLCIQSNSGMHRYQCLALCKDISLRRG